MKSTYQNQDRGSQKEYWQYLEAMDTIVVEKVASASVFFEPKEGNTIVDIGMASGTSSAILARLFPRLNIVGVDINPKMVEIAKRTYRLPNLSFRVDDGETLRTFSPNAVNGFFSCSSLHHITSYNGYDSSHAFNALRRQAELLSDNGVAVVRDFVKPQEQEVILELSAQKTKDRPSDSELLLRFSREARSLASLNERGFPIEELISNRPQTRRFRLFLTDATEFIRRKDYYNNWEVELREEYGYFTQQEFEQIFHDLGLQIVISSPIHNRWIINNRYREQLKLFDTGGNELGFPPTNYLIAGQKVRGGKQLSLMRHLPDLSNPFLQYTSHHNTQTDEVYDLVSRPNEVVDILPYYCNNSELYVLAKHAYPRPLAAIDNESSIDKKRFSGYITECMSAGVKYELPDVLSKRFGINPNQYNGIVPALCYYTSPGGINERVTSFFIQLNTYPQATTLLDSEASGFKTSGYISCYNASQLINTAQTGALTEARLELNIYRLFEELGMQLPLWLGEAIELKEGFSCKSISLNELLGPKNTAFISTNQKAGFLKSYRACFTEQGNAGSASILEYVTPQTVSINTLLTMPVNMKDGELYVGLELRDLPVPQHYTGNSRLLAVPAKRLPKSVTSLYALERYIEEMAIGVAKINRYFKLGEKYFPSVGTTPEQVYPYLVTLDSPATELYWVKASELFTGTNQIEDAHLLICLARLKHALKL